MNRSTSAADITPQTHEPVPHPDWIARWQQVARRIRVPLGFLVAGLYLVELWRHPPAAVTILWSLVLVLPGLWLRGFAAGYVKKNRELTVTGPYAFTRNPLYLGSMLMAVGFALALRSWPVAVVLSVGFLVIYIPVIASEERFLRATFPDFDDYCRRVPRLFPRLTPNRGASSAVLSRERTKPDDGAAFPHHGSFSFALYRQHHEYHAAIGVVLLYLCLLFLEPLLSALWRAAK